MLEVPVQDLWVEFPLFGLVHGSCEQLSKVVVHPWKMSH